MGIHAVVTQSDRVVWRSWLSMIISKHSDSQTHLYRIFISNSTSYIRRCIRILYVIIVYHYIHGQLLANYFPLQVFIKDSLETVLLPMSISNQIYPENNCFFFPKGFSDTLTFIWYLKDILIQCGSKAPWIYNDFHYDDRHFPRPLLQQRPKLLQRWSLLQHN